MDLDPRGRKNSVFKFKFWAHVRLIGVRFQIIMSRSK